jgi:endoglucanase Acf2
LLLFNLFGKWFPLKVFMKRMLPLKSSVHGRLLFFISLALLSLIFLIPSLTQSADILTGRPSGAFARLGECDVTGNTLYVIDGASAGVSSDLAFTAGNSADSDTMPQSSVGSHIVYRITGVTGNYTSTPTRFTLFLDAGTAVGNGIRAEIRYDFDGNGSDDRVETYNYFPTNPIVDWETYTEASSGGMETATGSYTNLSNGTIQLHLWNAIGGAPSQVRTSATAVEGQQSRVVLPFNNLSVGSCASPTPTNTPTASLTPTITPTPSPTPDLPPTATPTPSPTATPASSLCAGVSDTSLALPGVGCYTTKLPAGQTSVTFWPAVDNSASYLPATPKVTSNYSGPYQTNDWWSSLIWDWNQGAASAPPREPHSQSMHPHPFSIKAEADGLRMSYSQEIQAGTNTADTGAVTGYANFLLPGSGAEHLKVTVAGMNAPSTRVDDYSDWTVNAYWDGGANTLSATLGHGLPYVFFHKTGGAFTIKLVATPGDVVNSGEVFAFTASNNVGSRYALFAPTGSTWTQNGLNVTLNAPAGANYLAVAALPNNSAATLELFRQHAYNFVTDTTVDYSVDAVTQQVTSHFQITTVAQESGGTLSALPLIALYRHQWLNLADSPTDTGLTYTTSRGEMRLYEAAAFTTQMQFGGVLPALPDLPIDDLAGYTDAQLQAYINDIYNPSHIYDDTVNPHDTYWEGKNLNRIAQLVHLADQQGMITQRDSFLTYLKLTLEGWFDGQYPDVFYLDNNWNVLQGYPSGFGADSQINDHHFHWGYFVMTAGTIAQYDPTWATNYEGIIELLVRDAANWERTDTRFPYFRHFDAYAGHSWAAGHQAFGAGNNQESSSEAMNFAAGMILWGSAIGNDEMRDAGIYIYTTEQKAIEQYWFDVDSAVFPSAYPFETVGILWGHGIAYATWWTANPEEIHGINFLPLTASSLYLGQRPDYVVRNLAAVYAAPGAEGHWHDILWEYEAFADPASALARWASEPNYVADGAQEAGETAAHTYHWLHAFNAAGQVDTSVTANISTYAVFVNPVTGKRTCMAYNPTETGRTVTFSNGFTIYLAPRTLGSTPVGGCLSLGHRQFLPLILQ